MLFDTHMHSKWSGDCEAEPLDMIASAREKGLPGLTFTDHLDWDFPSVPHFFDLDLEHYLPEMRQIARTQSTDSFRIRVGLELGLQTHLVEKHRALLENYDFDVVIGSIHQVDGVDPYYDSYFKGRSFHDAYLDYFETTLENLNAFTDFDTLGHIDYIARYGQRFAKMHGGTIEDGALRYTDYTEVIDAILQRLIRCDKALEVNTAPFRQQLPEPNPSRDILRRYHELGGRMITIGADAHTPQDVAIGFASLGDWLKDCGFFSYVVFDHRRPLEFFF
ncbi:MAG: histidinol-phosphatase HisJ family protein [Lachnospiraceae bacterium]|nr:histidinol-phosphatase HisJ family protein [Lachnospiraceae bacterium]